MTLQRWIIIFEKTDILLLGQNEKNEHMKSNTLCYMGCYTGYKNTDKNFALHFVAFYYTIPLKISYYMYLLIMYEPNVATLKK